MLAALATLAVSLFFGFFRLERIGLLMDAETLKGISFRWVKSPEKNTIFWYNPPNVKRVVVGVRGQVVSPIFLCTQY